ncbi:AMP-binding protein [Iodobacter sp.]|uniref:AMP-binding protein n=1 Tax=Iodobacter sp. TaxID=1915058 RepID=UPI0025CDFD2D|nr:AMP-binding protein [Iodobacter sp.]
MIEKSEHINRYNNIAKIIENLHFQKNRTIIYWKRGSRIEKSHTELLVDIKNAACNITHLIENYNIEKIGICGQISYDWLVLDLACLLCGVVSIAIPSGTTQSNLNFIKNEIGIDLLLVDTEWQFNIPDSTNIIYFGEFGKNEENHIYSIKPSSCIIKKPTSSIYYTIALTSGTQGDGKALYLPYFEINSSFFKSSKNYINKDKDKVFIWMEFSHYIQRQVAFRALALGNNLVLSNSKQCISHLASEGATHMICTPYLYELLAENIQKKINNFNLIMKFFYKIYTAMKINEYGVDHLLYKIFFLIFIRKITHIYGGLAHEFIWNSANISPSALTTFYSIGIKLYGAYGISEIGPISTDNDSTFMLGSVGQPTRSVKISEENEILIMYDHLIRDKSRLNIDDDGYIHTGDIGYIKDGNLFVTGRLDDIIISHNGKKIKPLEIEQELMRSNEIRDACIFLEKKHKLCAIIVSNSDIKTIKNEIKEINNSLDDYCKINRFILARPFSLQDSTLTANFKKRRHSIQLMYQNAYFESVS